MSDSPAHPARLSPPELRLAMIAVLSVVLLGALEQTIVGVATPAIAQQLGGFDWMAWVVSGYLVAATVITPLAGRISDLYGRAPVMQCAVLLFLLASVACALAPSMPALVAARVLQGVAGGALLVLAQATIADLVATRERGRYQSYISIVWAVASLAGPVVGGLLTQHLAWQWIFWINLPIGLVALGLMRRALAALPRGRRAARIDYTGSALLLMGLSALLLPITRIGQGHPLWAAENLAGSALSALLLAAFAAQQRRQPDPVLPLELLRHRTVQAASCMLFICFVNFISLSVLVPLRLQLVAGLPSGDAAMYLLPLSLAIPLGSFSSGRWVYRTGHVRPLLQAGALLVPIGLALWAAGGARSPWALAGLAIAGLGTGMQLPTALLIVQHSVPQHLVGAATGLLSFFRLLGGAIGIAVLGSLLLVLLRHELPADAGEAGLAALYDMALGAAAGGLGAPVEAAFQTLMGIAAALSLASVVCARALPAAPLHAQ